MKLRTIVIVVNLLTGIAALIYFGWWIARTDPVLPDLDARRAEFAASVAEFVRVDEPDDERGLLARRVDAAIKSGQFVRALPEGGRTRARLIVLEEPGTQSVMTFLVLEPAGPTFDLTGDGYVALDDDVAVPSGTAPGSVRVELWMPGAPIGLEEPE
jgi:hypothetical protein